MEIVVEVVLYAGVVLMLVGWAWLVVLAFREDLLWGIGSLLCVLVALIFGARVRRAPTPVTLFAVGLLVWFIGRALAMAQ